MGKRSRAEVKRLIDQLNKERAGKPKPECSPMQWIRPQMDTLSSLEGFKWLDSAEGFEWLDTTEGLAWVNSAEGIAWLRSDRSRKWGKTGAGFQVRKQAMAEKRRVDQRAVVAKAEKERIAQDAVEAERVWHNQFRAEQELKRLKKERQEQNEEERRQRRHRWICIYPSVAIVVVAIVAITLFGWHVYSVMPESAPVAQPQSDGPGYDNIQTPTSNAKISQYHVFIANPDGSLRIHAIDTSTSYGAQIAERLEERDGYLTAFQQQHGISDEIAEAALKEWIIMHPGQFDWSIDEVKRICIRNRENGIPRRFLPPSDQ